MINFILARATGLWLGILMKLIEPGRRDPLSKTYVELHSTINESTIVAPPLPSFNYAHLGRYRVGLLADMIIYPLTSLHIMFVPYLGDFYTF